MDKQAAWRCCRRIASEVCPVELGAAARVAAGLGNTTLGTSLVSDGGGDKVRKVLTPLEEFRRHFQRRVSLEKVDDEFKELLVAEPAVANHDHVCKVKVEACKNLNETAATVEYTEHLPSRDFLRTLWRLRRL